MIVSRGTRDKLDKYFDISQPITFKMQIDGGAVYDFCCFGVDGDNKLSDDRYMIFYNQTSSPNNEITYKSAKCNAEFTINLQKLPATIQKLVFTASIDGNGTMSEISAHKFSIEQTNRDVINAEFKGADFQQEKAITAVEIYQKNGWRFNVIASGFNGGLDVLLKFYGGEETSDNSTPSNNLSESTLTNNLSETTLTNALSESTAQSNADSDSVAEKSKSELPVTETPQKISLEKKIEEGAPKLISLVKPLKVELEKRNLQNIIARVALVLDISGSMDERYRNGTVREIINKTLPLAVQFDDDGELDLWYYGSIPKRMDPVNMSNYENAVPRTWPGIMKSLGYGNNEPAVMREVIDEYKDSKLSAYVIFITDGGVGSNDEIKKLMIEASAYPIFWQFVGVGGYGYGILEQLDNLSGRLVDNANFFALDDFKTVPNPTLYSRLLNEFPAWIKEYAEYKSTGSSKSIRQNQAQQEKAQQEQARQDGKITNRIKKFFGF